MRALVELLTARAEAATSGAGGCMWPRNGYHKMFRDTCLGSCCTGLVSRVCNWRGGALREAPFRPPCVAVGPPPESKPCLAAEVGYTNGAADVCCTTCCVQSCHPRIRLQQVLRGQFCVDTFTLVRVERLFTCVCRVVRSALLLQLVPAAGEGSYCQCLRLTSITWTRPVPPQTDRRASES